jgi:hypothetical protein
MNILIIFDHNEQESYCLHAALDQCLRKNRDFCLRLKNLNTLCEFENLLWYKQLEKEYQNRISIYNGSHDDKSTNIVCSFTPKTPFFFLDSIKPKRIGLFFDKKVITNDYASPFLLMRNTPNKLNRETLYSLILNGSPASKDLYKDSNSIEASDIPIEINRCDNLNEKLFCNQNAVIILNKPIPINDITITGKNILLRISNHQEYQTTSVGDFTYMKSKNSQNVLEEIIHLSMIFTVFNLDYKLIDSDIDQKTLAVFNETIEHIFEALTLTQVFCQEKDIAKVKDSVLLCNKILTRFKVLLPIAEYFEMLNETEITESDDIYLSQMTNNCETITMICRTIYHLSTQKKKVKFRTALENN